MSKTSIPLVWAYWEIFLFTYWQFVLRLYRNELFLPCCLHFQQVDVLRRKYRLMARTTCSWYEMREGYLKLKLVFYWLITFWQFNVPVLSWWCNLIKTQPGKQPPTACTGELPLIYSSLCLSIHQHSVTIECWQISEVVEAIFVSYFPSAVTFVGSLSTRLHTAASGDQYIL